MAAYREHTHGRIVGAAFALYLAAMLVLLGIVLWRLWTEVFAGIARVLALSLLYSP